MRDLQSLLLLRPTHDVQLMPCLSEGAAEARIHKGNRIHNYMAWFLCGHPQL